MTGKLRTTRTITAHECPWLVRDVPPGLVVWVCPFYTYGVCSPRGQMVVRDPDQKHGAFELPNNALEPVFDA